MRPGWPPRTTGFLLQSAASRIMTALYRKYRPQDFDEVVGQEAVVQTLRNAIETDQVRQACCAPSRPPSPPRGNPESPRPPPPPPRLSTAPRGRRRPPTTPATRAWRLRTE